MKRWAQVVIGVAAFAGIVLAGHLPPAAQTVGGVASPNYVAQIDSGTSGDGGGTWQNTSFTG
jgi:hypothetical protein